jgi:hypothetical protein
MNASVGTSSRVLVARFSSRIVVRTVSVYLCSTTLISEKNKVKSEKNKEKEKSRFSCSANPSSRWRSPCAAGV